MLDAMDTTPVPPTTTTTTITTGASSSTSARSSPAAACSACSPAPPAPTVLAACGCRQRHAAAARARRHRRHDDHDDGVVGHRARSPRRREETAGPYPGDGSNGANVLTQSGVVRSDIRSSFGSSTTTADGRAADDQLTVARHVGRRRSPATPSTSGTATATATTRCTRLPDENYLRGVQETAADGTVTFTTIFPAATPGAGRTSTSRCTRASARRRAPATRSARRSSPSRGDVRRGLRDERATSRACATSAGSRSPPTTCSATAGRAAGDDVRRRHQRLHGHRHLRRLSPVPTCGAAMGAGPRGLGLRSAPDVRRPGCRHAAAARAQTALGHRLTLVVAAPGWGKTTLLRTLAAAAPAVEVARPPAGWTPFSLARQLVDGSCQSARRRRAAAGPAGARLGRPPRADRRPRRRRLRRRRRRDRRRHARHPRRRRRRGRRSAARTSSRRS